MSTALKRGMGHFFGSGAEKSTEGSFPVWLEQVGSRIMGGVIDLQHKYTDTIKVIDLYPEAISTGTPCYDTGEHNYVPLPTFRVIEDVSANATKIKLAVWDGCAKLINGIDLALSSDQTKTITTAANNLALQDDGTYKLTITANAFGVLKVGDSLVLKQAVGKSVIGLTKSNLQYKGTNPEAKLTVTLVDAGRLLSAYAPALPSDLKEKLQTIKYEEE